MRVVLVFSPFGDPSYIPLGIAQLKGYIKQQLPFVQVRNLDLSITFFNNLTKEEFLNRLKHLCQICPGKRKQHSHIKSIYKYEKLYALAFNCLKDKLSKEFYDAQKYNYLMQQVLSFSKQCNNCLSIIFKDIIENGNKIPRLLENLLQEDINRILNEKPNIVGFSIFSEEQLSHSIILASILKKHADLPIIFGGAFMSYIDVPALMGNFNFIDFVMPREGEIGLTEFIRHFKDKNPKEISGIFYRRENEIILNKEKSIRDLDSLPFPDFSDFDLRHYLFPIPVLPIIFSRGCSWRKCTFCAYFKHYPYGYKTKSVHRFIQELRYFNARGIKYFMIDDDVIPAAHLNSISKAIIKESLDIFFAAITRPEKDFSFRVLKNIYQAGGRAIFWGVESSSQRILNLMNKGTRIKTIESILDNAYRIGFHNHFFMIRGFPTQTEKEILNDVRFLRRNYKYISFFVHNFFLEKNSFIFRNSEKFKIHSLKEIPIYGRRNKSLFSNIIFFKRRKKINWQKIKKMEDKILGHLRKTSPLRFGSLSHAHVLIHSSSDKKLINDNSI